MSSQKVYEICKRMYEDNELQKGILETSKDCAESVQVYDDFNSYLIELKKDIKFCESGYLLRKEGLTLDCKGHTIKGLSKKDNPGISISAKKVRVENCKIEDFEVGVSISFTEDITIKNVDAYKNSLALQLAETKNNNIELVGSEIDYKRKIQEVGSSQNEITYTKK